MADLADFANWTKGFGNPPVGLTSYSRRTDCDGCGERMTLHTIDNDGVLIGDECPQCGYYTTRYMPGQAPQ